MSDRGRLTTNSVEGFHGLALVYRDKRTDLCHTHYVCKTNMAICHKVGNIWSAKIFRIFFFILGPIWKVFCLVEMGMDIPAAAILKEQEQWETEKLRRSSKDNVHKRLATRSVVLS